MYITDNEQVRQRLDTMSEELHEARRKALDWTKKYQKLKEDIAKGPPTVWNSIILRYYILWHRKGYILKLLDLSRLVSVCFNYRFPLMQEESKPFPGSSHEQGHIFVFNKVVSYLTQKLGVLGAIIV